MYQWSLFVTARVAPHLSAIDMIEMAICEHLVLVAGLIGFDQFVTMPSAPTHPPFTLQPILDCTVFLSLFKNNERVIIWPTPGLLRGVHGGAT